MKCFIVFYFVTILFVLGMCSSKYCTFENIDMTINPDGVIVRCYNRKHMLHFIPPIIKFILRIEMYHQKIEQLPSNAFQNLSSQYNVSYIRLDNCKIHHIDADAFMNLHNLTFISLDFNDIKYLDSRTFQHVPKVWYISMHHNQIELLPKGLFENLPLLEAVFLASNQIRLIEANTFSNTPLLILIDLDWNKLQYLDVSFKDSISNDTFFYLEHNPWTCDCNLIDLYDLHMRRPQYSVLICENPPTLRGTEWTDLTRDQFICDPRIEILSNETKEVPVGGSVILSCVVYSHDKPNIKWRKGSTIITSDHLSSSSDKHKHFLNYTFYFDENDADVYYCSAELADGRLEANITLECYSRTKNHVLDTTEFSDIPQDDNITLNVYSGRTSQVLDTTKSADDQQDDKTTLTIYNGTRYQQVDTSTPQPLFIPNWTPYTIFVLVLVCVAAVIIGIVLFVRYTLAKSNRRRHVRLPTDVKRRLFLRTNTRNMDNGIPMRVFQSSTVLENSDSE